VQFINNKTSLKWRFIVIGFVILHIAVYLEAGLAV